MPHTSGNSQILASSTQPRRNTAHKGHASASSAFTGRWHRNAPDATLYALTASRTKRMPSTALNAHTLRPVAIPGPGHLPLGPRRRPALRDPEPGPGTTRALPRPGPPPRCGHRDNPARWAERHVKPPRASSPAGHASSAPPNSPWPAPRCARTSRSSRSPRRSGYRGPPCTATSRELPTPNRAPVNPRERKKRDELETRRPHVRIGGGRGDPALPRRTLRYRAGPRRTPRGTRARPRRWAIRWLHVGRWYRPLRCPRSSGFSGVLQ